MWVLCVLFEDGASSALSSKKLSLAKFANKTYRARFPRPVALVFSRGALSPGAPTAGGPPLEEGGLQERISRGGALEEALIALTQGAPEAWEHFVCPVADFALRLLQQQQPQQIEAAAVWGLVSDLLLSRKRGPQGGAPLLVWSSQETLRPVLADSPSIRQPSNPKP